MPRIYLVRHGEADGTFGAHRDPGLSELGREQAEAAAEALADKGPMAVFSSPLLRAQETAAPLARRWGVPVTIDERVREVPSPTEDLGGRAEWLREFMRGTWDEAPQSQARWREGVLAALRECAEPAVFFTHFIPINAVVGVAKDLDRIVNFWPDNASITVVEVTTHAITILDLGREAETKVK